MAGFDHLLKSYDIRDLLDDIASADPPAYLRRCFAEGLSTPALSFPRIQQIAVCAMVLDAILNGRDYEPFEPELIGDWRAHHLQSCSPLKNTAIAALHRAREQIQPSDADASDELGEIARRLGGG